MKKLLLLIALGFIISVGNLNAQKKSYFSGGYEMIFSWASVDYTDSAGVNYVTGNIMRWAPVLNLQGMYNYDASKTFGLFAGLAIRNVGYIWNKPGNSGLKYKFRTYNLAIPVGFKIGNMKNFFVYGGYEIEFPFNYKEKTFVDGTKRDVFVDWFSGRVEPVQHSVLVGINFKYGFNLKFKYYFSNFHNEDFTGTDIDTGEYGYKPYAGLKDKVWYISLNFGLFEHADKYYNPKKWEEEIR